MASGDPRGTGWELGGKKNTGRLERAGRCLLRGQYRIPDYLPSLTTFSAAGPFWPCTMSNSTRSPSASVLKP